MVTILIAEDDRNVRLLLGETLRSAGFTVIESRDGKDALDQLDQQHVDLVVTDVMMPHVSGIELVELLRESGYEQPVLMLTVLDSFQDKEAGFTTGADDYMVKPVDLDELLLRIRALLRRSKIVAAQELIVGALQLRMTDATVVTPHGEIPLPQKEFQLLYRLLAHPKQIFTRQQLMDEIWGYDVESDSRTVDVHIKRLRDKFSAYDDFTIETVWGLGYKGVIQ
ncbi:response regulator transcription factor [Exiguobacterium sp. A1_3_1]|uniref:response regulator transcription factor n=1 Tax=Exiguobacterium TaxID=33986 RepID=UPI0003C3BB41|nr:MULTISPECIES: response regulator transcription factor [Exiguobacterium]AHA29831.1 heme response regulator HssR [Exiguobacterium sp. MH3]MBF8152879.1 response regulator transcription factor [Exiguobacterium sp. TBG-PICH-001]QZY85404.1 response regulator transcription factor [Exiguobacterium acetylicum]